MFSNIIGHDRVKAELERDMKARRLHHAYLFSGPEHIGKMALLREFMTHLRMGKSFDPSSVFGQQVLVGQGPGLMSFLDDGESLKVDEIRKIVDFVSLRTADGEFSFCVIEGVERMTRSAANAFLKILEEPAPRIMYLMTTRSEKKLLPTVLSRVQTIRFSLPSPGDIRAFLQQWTNNPVLIEELMKLSVGRIGLAVTMMEDEALLERMRQLYDYAMIVFEDDLVDRFTLADHLTQKDASSVELTQFLVYLALKFQQEGAKRFLLPLERTQRLYRLFQETQVNKRLTLEELFLSFP
jgi:DNA polymerase-3 subunit delta'